MRFIGLIMAAFGGGAALFVGMVGGGQAVLPLLVWFIVCIVGITLVVTHPSAKKDGK